MAYKLHFYCFYLYWV